MKRATHIVVRALLSASVLSSLATVGWSQQPAITWLGTLGGRYSFGHAVSADGKVVVGYAHTTRDDGRQFRAFRWTAETGMVDLGNFSSVFNNSWA
jgi:probable HAF family extracellular repeat protein